MLACTYNCSREATGFCVDCCRDVCDQCMARWHTGIRKDHRSIVFHRCQLCNILSGPAKIAGYYCHSCPAAKGCFGVYLCSRCCQEEHAGVNLLHGGTENRIHNVLHVRLNGNNTVPTTPPITASSVPISAISASGHHERIPASSVPVPATTASGQQPRIPVNQAVERAAPDFATFRNRMEKHFPPKRAMSAEVLAIPSTFPAVRQSAQVPATATTGVRHAAAPAPVHESIAEAIVPFHGPTSATADVTQAARISEAFLARPASAGLPIHMRQVLSNHVAILARQAGLSYTPTPATTPVSQAASIHVPPIGADTKAPVTHIPTSTTTPVSPPALTPLPTAATTPVSQPVPTHISPPATTPSSQPAPTPVCSSATAPVGTAGPTPTPTTVGGQAAAAHIPASATTPVSQAAPIPVPPVAKPVTQAASIPVSFAKPVGRAAPISVPFVAKRVSQAAPTPLPTPPMTTVENKA
ncbi:uncharacterized protein EV422DRAFT_582999, partial [Fimicolochytrium jonesii]|uniref:uncharacterized protein n=1 Tax=Fimicolochytrium jonesii TaxID=1396493 RepID=UPI0022FE4C8C